MKPFINDKVLQEIFGADAEKVKREFLVPGPGGIYFLKLEFATQREVENHFAKLEARRAKPEAQGRVVRFDQQRDFVRGGKIRRPRIPFSAGDAGHIVIQKSRSADAGEAEGALRGLFFPATGRFLDAGSAAKTSGVEARHQHADLRRRFGHGARLRAGVDETTGPVEPGNPAHAQSDGRGIFAPGGCALFERRHAGHA